MSKIPSGKRTGLYRQRGLYLEVLSRWHMRVGDSGPRQMYGRQVVCQWVLLEGTGEHLCE